MKKIKKGFQLAFILFVALSICSFATNADAVTVTNTADSGAGSLRQAIIDVEDGGTISFDNALSGDVITLSSEISINKSLTIQGLGADKLSISGNNNNRIFYIRSNSTVNISDLAIVNGNTTSTDRKYGGGINLFAGCNLNLQNVNFENCVAGSNGGAIFGGNATKINIKNCAFKSNSAGDVGGAIKVSAMDVIPVTKPRAILSIEDSLFYGNNATNVGGAIYIEAAVDSEIDNCTFTDNQSNATGDGRGGGAIYAIQNLNYSPTLKIENSSFFKNRNNNTYNRNGGAIYVSNLASLVIDSCFFSENGLDKSAYNGGAVYIDKSPTLIKSSMFSNNAAEMFGGAVFIYGSPVEIRNTTFNQNSSTRGGGISKTGFLSDSNTLTMINCTLAGNTAEIWNSDGNQGGGIYYDSYGGLDLSFCTISGNVAKTSGNGIYTVQKNYLDLKNCIVAANTGSGSQIADSTDGTTNYSQSFSVISGDIVSSDLFAGDLAANDGPLVGSTVSADQVPLLTLALKPGSLAIDSAASTDINGIVVSEDQRGATRPQGSGYDIGAFELELNSYTITATSSAGGSITPESADVPEGIDQMFTIREDKGYLLKELLADGSVVSADIAGENTYTFTFENVSSDHTLTAGFETAPDTDDPDNNGGGTCSVGTFTPLAALLLLPVLLMFKK